MALQWTSIAIFPLVGAIVLLFAAVASLPHRKQRGAKSFIWMSMGGATWAAGYVFELCSRDIPTALFWANLQYIGLCSLPPAFLSFALLHTGRVQRFRAREMALLGFGLVTTVPIAFSDRFHTLFRNDVVLREFPGEVFLLQFTKGPWYTVNNIYSYVLLGWAVVAMASAMRGRNQVFRTQTRILVLCTITPFIVNILYVFGISPLPFLDLTPTVFAVTGVGMAVTIFRWSLFDLAPVAREMLVDKLPDPVLVLDRLGRVVDANQAAHELFNREEGLMQQPFVELLADFESRESSVLSRDQREFQVKRSKLTNPGGETVGEVVQMVDITERSSYEQLLQVAMAEAEAGSQSKSRFMANISHEVRTPLSGVIGVADILRETPLTPEQTELVDAIQSCGRTLLGIVNDILDFSKSEAKEDKLHPTSTPIHTVLRDVATTHELLARRKGLDFEFLIDRTVPQVGEIDTSKLRQIASNLLGNAVKFTSTGSVKFLVSCPTKSQLKIIVSDTGIGIPEHEHENIFRPFHQADNSDRRVYGGTGLGLAIVMQIVQLMSGSVTLDSAVGRGSTFEVVIPFRAVNPGMVRPGEIPVVQDGLAVLLAEDNRVNAMVISRLLRGFGCQVRHVETGAAAVEAALAGRFDIILLDLQMPELDGFRAFTAIREAQPDGPPVYALTANANETDRDRSIAIGITGFLTKPISAEELAAVLGTIQAPTGLV